MKHLLLTFEVLSETCQQWFPMWLSLTLSGYLVFHVSFALQVVTEHLLCVAPCVRKRIFRGGNHTRLPAQKSYCLTWGAGCVRFWEHRDV